MAAITKQLVQQVDQWIARHRDEMVDEVCRLIRFPSVAAALPPATTTTMWASFTAPSGKGNRSGLA